MRYKITNFSKNIIIYENERVALSMMKQADSIEFIKNGFIARWNKDGQNGELYFEIVSVIL